MARSKRMSVQKRLREKKKAEAAAMKREMKAQQKTEAPAGGEGQRVAAREDLEGYGLITEEPEEETEA